ncbi:MAG: hypothetical protein CM15mP78_07260 [Candidatus Poseidoniales archaeon]|nr:MAG: hypothetical protein CM15mP78_07260 [Candidatus Poseidoniales archaeon]
MFAPSYAMLNEVVLEGAFTGARIMAESREWTKQDLDQVVDTLLEEKRHGRKILLAGVFGARLSEGVDYHSGALDAVACIGIPIRRPPFFQNHSKPMRKSGSGATLPGDTRSLNRPSIPFSKRWGGLSRSIGDRALILLLDRRVTTAPTPAVSLPICA